MSAMSYIPRLYPHRWLPDGVELTTWEQIEPWYHPLLERPIGSQKELEDWLFDVSELSGAVGQEGVAAVYRDDLPDRRSRAGGGLPGVRRDIEPKLKPIQNAIRSRYLDSPHRSGLPRDRYFVFDRAMENRRALFREANIPREAELAELEQQYQRTMG